MSASLSGSSGTGWTEKPAISYDSKKGDLCTPKATDA